MLFLLTMLLPLLLLFIFIFVCFVRACARSRVISVESQGSLKNFDLVFVFKDYNRMPLRIAAIPRQVCFSLKQLYRVIS
jgi:nucleosome binding factor SPN SPT16 subunit